MNPDEEYFIRELTRKLDEQINSIRRELDNLKKMGMLKSSTKNRKKYYHVNKNFLFLDELKGIVVKAMSTNDTIAKDISKTGAVKVLVLSGVFVEKDTDTVDMLIVGDVDKEKLADYINNEVKTRRPIKFTLLNEEDYKYRISCHDRFIEDLISDSGNQVLIKKI